MQVGGLQGSGFMVQQCSGMQVGGLQGSGFRVRAPGLRVQHCSVFSVHSSAVFMVHSSAVFMVQVQQCSWFRFSSVWGSWFSSVHGSGSAVFMVEVQQCSWFMVQQCSWFMVQQCSGSVCVCGGGHVGLTHLWIQDPGPCALDPGSCVPDHISQIQDPYISPIFCTCCALADVRHRWDP